MSNGVENQAAEKRKKVRERQVLEKNRRKMSSILRGGIRIPPQEEERRRSLEVGDERIPWRLARGAIPEKNGGEKKGADEKKKSEKARAWRRFEERCRQKQGAGSESRPRKKKEGGAWKWAMRAFTGARP